MRPLLLHSLRLLAGSGLAGLALALTAHAQTNLALGLQLYPGLSITGAVGTV